MEFFNNVPLKKHLIIHTQSLSRFQRTSTNVTQIAEQLLDFRATWAIEVTINPFLEKFSGLDTCTFSGE